MEELPKTNSVRAIIDLFEDNCRNETAIRLNKNMSKSFAGLSFPERKFASSYQNDADLFYLIDKRLTSVSSNLQGYKTYAKEIHIALQDDLIEIINILITVEPKNNTQKYKKKELMYDIKTHFDELSNRLPAFSDQIHHGFGDSSYKPFSWKRPNSISAVGLNENDLSPRNKSLIYPNDIKPQRTQSVIDKYIDRFQELSKNGEVNEKTKDLRNGSPDVLIDGRGGIRHPANPSFSKRTDSAPGAKSKFSTMVIGGASGVRRPITSPDSSSKSPGFIIGGQGGIRRPLNPSYDDISKNASPAESIDNVELRKKNLHRSSSEVLEDKAGNRPATIGRSESAKWTYGELRGRRRPVSLGGTVFTLNSPKDIISSVNFSKSSDVVFDSPGVEDNIQEFENYEVVEDDNNLQSVNMLKQFFELKSDEKAKLEKQKSFDYKEDQRGEFQKYVESIEKSIQDEGDHNLAREDSGDNSSNNTIVEVDFEDDEFGASKRVVLDRASSIVVDEVEGLNCPVLRSTEVKEVDEVIITTTVREDVDEVGSYSSDKSIYLDPVD